MTHETIEIGNRISEIIHQVDPDAEVYLFGSRANGKYHADSDWDILILTIKKSSLEKERTFRHSLIPLELEIGEPLSVFVYSKKSWETKHRITPFYKTVQLNSVRI